jgi:hypothetical protein
VTALTDCRQAHHSPAVTDCHNYKEAPPPPWPESPGVGIAESHVPAVEIIGHEVKDGNLQMR